MTRMHRFVRIVACGLVASASLLPAGCMLPYAYPQVSRVAGVDVSRQAAEVHAFRVDARVRLALEVGSKEATEDYRLGRVPLAADGRVPSDARVEFDYGLYVFGMTSNNPVHFSHHTETRLYRRGFQLIEVGGETKAGEVDWKLAADLEAQEKAVDDLLALPRLGASVGQPPLEWSWSLAKLSPGSVAAAHREALLFASDEYARLAALAGPEGKTSERLSRKAQKVRAWAAR